MIITVPVVPPPPPPPPGGQRPTLLWEWVTPGRVWTLSDSSSPVIKLEGAKGLGASDLTHWWADSPMLPGSTWNGYRAERGELFLPVMVQADDTDTFVEENRAFLVTLDPSQEAEIRISRPDGQWRYKRVRYVSGAELTADYDPVRALYAMYGLTFATADPYWSGKPVDATFLNDVPDAFFPGPPFNLGSGLNISDAFVTNPGDVEAFPRWKVWGPFTGFSVGVGDAVVSVTLTKSAGEWVQIDMDPRKLTIVDEAGTDRWPVVDDASFTAIPPGVDLPLAVTVVGSGAASQVDLIFTPRYRAAW